jgi:hypothetical protein
MGRICTGARSCRDGDFLCKGGFGSSISGGGMFLGEERDDDDAW